MEHLLLGDIECRTCDFYNKATTVNEERKPIPTVLENNELSSPSPSCLQATSTENQDLIPSVVTIDCI